MTNELDKEIGTKEQPKLTPGSVIVSEVTIEEIPTKKGGKVKIVCLQCKHPDREEPVKLSSMKIKKIQGNNETIMKDGIWYREDADGFMDKYCRASELCRFYNMKTLRQFENTPINTELDANGYLVIKAY